MECPYLTYAGAESLSPTSVMIKRLALKNTGAMRKLPLPEQRAAKERLGEARIIMPGVYAEETTHVGIPCQSIQLKEGGYPDKVILYLHGGGWALNNERTAKAFGVFLCEATGCKVLIPGYRLAPEHPFPAGLDDCLAVYQWLLTCGYREQDIGLFGDSAGGNLCLCLTHRLIALGYDVPACIGLASPVTDARDTSAVARSGDDLIFTQYGGREQDIFSLYAGDQDRSGPLLSPICGDLARFPPILIHTGGDEPLSADNIAFGEKAYSQGADVAVCVFRGMFHNFTVVGRTLRESRESVAGFGRFFLEHLCTG